MGLIRTLLKAVNPGRQTSSKFPHLCRHCGLAVRKTGHGTGALLDRGNQPHCPDMFDCAGKPARVPHSIMPPI